MSFSGLCQLICVRGVYCSRWHFNNEPLIHCVRLLRHFRTTSNLRLWVNRNRNFHNDCVRETSVHPSFHSLVIVTRWTDGKWTGKQSQNKMFYVAETSQDQWGSQGNNAERASLFPLSSWVSLPLIDPGRPTGAALYVGLHQLLHLKCKVFPVDGPEHPSRTRRVNFLGYPRMASECANVSD